MFSYLHDISKLRSWCQEECSPTQPCHHGFTWVFNKGRVRSHHRQRKLHGRPLQCNPTKLPFPKITQNTECCLMNITVEQVNCKLLNKSAFKRICRNNFNLKFCWNLRVIIHPETRFSNIKLVQDRCLSTVCQPKLIFHFWHTW